MAAVVALRSKMSLSVRWRRQTARGARKVAAQETKVGEGGKERRGWGRALARRLCSRAWLRLAGPVPGEAVVSVESRRTMCGMRWAARQAPASSSIEPARDSRSVEHVPAPKLGLRRRVQRRSTLPAPAACALYTPPAWVAVYV
jgi:hypothetical protein